MESAGVDEVGGGRWQGVGGRQRGGGNRWRDYRGD